MKEKSCETWLTRKEYEYKLIGRVNGRNRKQKKEKRKMEW